MIADCDILPEAILTITAVTPMDDNLVAPVYLLDTLVYLNKPFNMEGLPDTICLAICRRFDELMDRGAHFTSVNCCRFSCCRSFSLTAEQSDKCSDLPQQRG